MLFKKFFAVLFAALMCFFVISGCAQEDTSIAPPTAKSASASPEPGTTVTSMDKDRPPKFSDFAQRYDISCMTAEEHSMMKYIYSESRYLRYKEVYDSLTTTLAENIFTNKLGPYTVVADAGGPPSEEYEGLVVIHVGSSWDGYTMEAWWSEGGIDFSQDHPIFSVKYFAGEHPFNMLFVVDQFESNANLILDWKDNSASVTPSYFDEPCGDAKSKQYTTKNEEQARKLDDYMLGNAQFHLKELEEQRTTVTS